ncbi:MAG: polysaccharide biosynthesis/export family protein [Bacteroidota bacterium]
MKYSLGILFLLILLSSCVQNRKIVYLQNNDLHKEVPLDSTVHKYSVIPYDYKIQPWDILLIRFESLTDKEFDFLKTDQQVPMVSNGSVPLAGELVSAEGELHYPVIGTVKVTGLSVSEIQEKLQQLADQYLESPKVTVRLLNFRVTVLGEVTKETQVTLSNYRVNMMEAIGLAGGLGELADRTKVKLIRQSGNEASVQYIDLLDEKFIESPYYYVHQNDIIVVPPLKQRAFRRYFGSNLALIVSSVSVLLLTYNLLTTH